MKKGLLLAVLAAFMITPFAATAQARTNTFPNPPVLYVLRGVLSNYTAYNAATQTPGSITILVKGANFHATALHNQSLTFAVGPKTRITLLNGVHSIANGDRGGVGVWAPLRIPAGDLTSKLQSKTASRIVDVGPPPTS